MIFKISGLFIGLLFGFLLKRGRFCPTGTIRDIYLEKKYYNAVLILAVIATEGVLYHLLVGSGVITTPFFRLLLINRSANRRLHLWNRCRDDERLHHKHSRKGW